MLCVVAQCGLTFETGLGVTRTQSISVSGTANNICDLALTPAQMGPALEGVPVW